MAEQSYDLMHKDDIVASLQLDDLSGAILKVTPGANPELLPLGGSQGADSLRKWWLRRAVPISQGNIAALLQQEGIPSTQSLLVRNLGLSLSDHYWIKPNGSELTWKDVSLFSNSFRDPLESMQIQHPHGAASTSTQTPAYSPSASLQGDLIKKWLIVDDTRCLLKGNRGANSQQSLNEVLASMLHEKQGFANHVQYRPVKFTGSASEQYGCICEDFASETLEFIPAIDVVDSEKKDNAVSTYEHFIHVCTAHGLSELEVRSFLEYQILTDFVLTNTDRHLNNFGVLRNSRTLQFVRTPRACRSAVTAQRSRSTASARQKRSCSSSSPTAAVSIWTCCPVGMKLRSCTRKTTALHLWIPSSLATKRRKRCWSVLWRKAFRHRPTANVIPNLNDNFQLPCKALRFAGCFF